MSKPPMVCYHAMAAARGPEIEIGIRIFCKKVQWGCKPCRVLLFERIRNAQICSSAADVAGQALVMMLGPPAPRGNKSSCILLSSWEASTGLVPGH